MIAREDDPARAGDVLRARDDRTEDDPGDRRHDAVTQVVDESGAPGFGKIRSGLRGLVGLLDKGFLGFVLGSGHCSTLPP